MVPGFLLLVYLSGGSAASVAQIGPVWPTIEACTSAKTAADAFLLRERGNALVDGGRPPNAESACIPLGQ